MERKNILIVGATAEEVEGLTRAPGIKAVSTGQIFPLNDKRHTIDLMVTGPGMVSTAFFLGKLLSVRYYDLAINAGIAGSFNKTLAIGDVVNVVSDSFAELGAESGENFIPLYEMDMCKPYLPAFIKENGIIENHSYPSAPAITELPAVKGITVNTISGDEQQIEKNRHRTHADIETMEGAAFFYACHMSGIKCLQIRAISNYVEPRNLKNWDIPAAVKNLNACLKNILNEI